MTLSVLTSALKSGGVVLVPTDTVYGIAADPSSASGIATIFEMKERPADSPLPILGASTEQLRTVAKFDERSGAAADRFWPGPLTMVLPRASGFTSYLGGSTHDTVAVRVPRSEPLCDLLRTFGPLAVTSANISGQPPASTLAEARSVFGRIPYLEDDEGEAAGEASTVVSFVGAPKILRAGAITLDQIEACLHHEK